MFKCKIYTALLTATLFFSSCLFDSSSDRIIGRYNVTWIDVPSSRTICMDDNNDDDGGGIQLIPAYVYAVGHTKRFIIAKNHPVVNERDGSVNTKKTNYFIIDLSKDNYVKSEGIYGPLNEKEFGTLLQRLNVGQIDFDMSYPEQP